MHVHNRSTVPIAEALFGWTIKGTQVLHERVKKEAQMLTMREYDNQYVPLAVFEPTYSREHIT